MTIVYRLWRSLFLDAQLAVVVRSICIAPDFSSQLAVPGEDRWWSRPLNSMDLRRNANTNVKGVTLPVRVRLVLIETTHQSHPRCTCMRLE